MARYRRNPIHLGMLDGYNIWLIVFMGSCLRLFGNDMQTKGKKMKLVKEKEMDYED